MANIQLTDITKRYPDKTEAVKQLSLDIADGELMVLVGPSGCGKSTALRMIAGLEEISEGELQIGGERVNEQTPADRDVAMVFQNYALYPHMTVRENMGFALRLAKTPKAEAAKRVEDAATMLDLTDHLDRKPARLSGGQRQRVAMGRAVVRQPRAFLMDEPLSNLDAKLRVQMRLSLGRLQRDLATTTVYVTHDQTEAMTLGDRVAVMRGGVLQQVATPATLYEQPANLFVAGFMGSPTMNLLPGRLEDGALQCPLGCLPLPSGFEAGSGSGATPSGRDVIVGIRPENFEDARSVNGDGPPRVRTRVRVEIVESMGSDLYAYFSADVPSDKGAALARLLGQLEQPGLDGGAVSSGTSKRPVSARLHPDSAAAVGQEIELALDVSRVKLFDPESGQRLH